MGAADCDLRAAALSSRQRSALVLGVLGLGCSLGAAWAGACVAGGGALGWLGRRETASGVLHGGERRGVRRRLVRRSTRAALLAFSVRLRSFLTRSGRTACAATV